jgi:hypothetical protein
MGTCHLTDKHLSYDHLASGLKLALEKDKTALDADRLQNYTGNLFFIMLSYFRSHGSAIFHVPVHGCTSLNNCRNVKCYFVVLVAVVYE